MSFFGQNIRFLRNRQQMSQAAFAQLFGLTRATLGAYEEERAEPKVDLFVKIANHFGLTLEELLCRSLAGGGYADAPGDNGKGIPFVRADEAEAYAESASGGGAYDHRNHIQIPGLGPGAVAFEYGNNILIAKERQASGGLFERDTGKRRLLLRRGGLSVVAAGDMAADALRTYEIAYIIKRYDGDDHAAIMLDEICKRLGKIEDRLS